MKSLQNNNSPDGTFFNFCISNLKTNITEYFKNLEINKLDIGNSSHLNLVQVVFPTNFIIFETYLQLLR